MDVPDLRGFTAEDEIVILQMLEAVVNHSDIHVNRIQVRKSKDGMYSTFVGLKSAGVPSPATHQFLSQSNLVQRLHGNSFAVPEAVQSGWYQFTEKAFEWYKHKSQPTASMTRRRIGEELYKLWQLNPAIPLRRGQHIDVGRFCANYSISPEVFSVQAHMLIKLGYARFSDHSENTVDEGYIALADPEGFIWASQDFPDASAFAPPLSLSIDINLKISIENFIVSIATLPIPDSEKREVTKIAKEFEEEPKFETASRLVGFAANTKELFLPVCTLIANNADRIAHLLTR